MAWSQVNWEALAVVATLIVFICSLFYQSWRDRKNKLRDIRTTYLIETYKLLAKSVNRENEKSRYFECVESAMTDIQLLGTHSQIKKIHAISEKVRNETANIDELLNELRNDLRSELRLPSVDGNVLIVRFKK